MDVLSLPVLRADHRIHYGPDPSQFGDLWLPDVKAGHLVPVVVFFHGGWWKSEYDLGYAGYVCEALKNAGIATWSVEYRRVGRTGGGWPATFQDAAQGLEFVSTLARTYPLDLHRVAAMGHSAGAHLAFWCGGRMHIGSVGGLSSPAPAVALRGIIALAGAVDLRLTIDLSGSSIFAHDRDEVRALMGGTPEDVPERYHAGNPGDLLPLSAPQILIQGTKDDQIPPELPARWAELARSRGSQATVKIVADADHFDVVDPRSRAWETVLAQVKKMIAV